MENAGNVELTLLSEFYRVEAATLAGDLNEVDSILSSLTSRQTVLTSSYRIPAVSANPERVVFIDETSVKTNLTRLRGWAPRGDRLVMDAPFGSWVTQTFVAGLTADAMIAPLVIKGAMDGAAFAAYVEKVLVPELAPGTVVILDNLAT